MKGKLILMLLLISAMVACRRTPEPPPQLTGVHLQASFDVPDLVEGEPASNDMMDYLLYLPEGFGEDADERWPMIMFLHGSGSDVYDSKFVMSAGLPEVLFSGDQPDPFPFVVVSPQAFPGTPWWVGDTLLVLNLLIDEVIDNYQIDPERVYLTGLSMGGYGTWYMATAFPERFAAAASVSGSGYQTSYLPETELFCRMEDVPLWSIHGVQDKISAPNAAKVMTDVLATQCDSEVKWTAYPDEGHMGAFIKAYRDPELYEWMLAHSKSQGEN